MYELAALGAAVTWAVSSTIIKPLSARFDAVRFNALRCTTASVFFWMLLLLTAKLALLAEMSAWGVGGLVGSAALAIGLGDTLYFRGLARIEVARAYPISSSAYPLFTMFIAAGLLGEAFGWRSVLGAALVVTGIFLVAFPGSPMGVALPEGRRAKRGIALVIAAAVCWAVSISILKAALADTEPLVANAIRISATAMLLLAVASAQRSNGVRQAPVPLRFLALGAFTGLLDFGLGSSLLLVSIQHIGAGRTALLSSVSPLVLVVLSLVFLKERLTWRLGAGVLLSVGGIYLLV